MNRLIPIVSLLIGLSLVGIIVFQQFAILKSHEEMERLRRQIPQTEIPKSVTEIAERMQVVIVESEAKNRTVYLDPNQSFCKVIVFYGGSDPISWDLAYPNAAIVFFFLEDIEDPEKADNYSDLIIRMNPIVDRADGKLKMLLVFFAEGGYDKLVYYKDLLLHYYKDIDATSNYGIRLLDTAS